MFRSVEADVELDGVRAADNDAGKGPSLGQAVEALPAEHDASVNVNRGYAAVGDVGPVFGRVAGISQHGIS